LKNEKLKILRTELPNILINLKAQLGLINVRDPRITNLPKLNVIIYGFRKTDYPNLGVAYLVANLRKTGHFHNYLYLEPYSSVETACQEILKLHPDIICFSACSVDFNTVISLSEKIKKQSNVLIFLGGAHISSVPFTLPKYIDIGFIGESEETIVKIFNLIQKGQLNDTHLKKIKGIAYYNKDHIFTINDRNEPIKILDSIPHPARDIFKDGYWSTGVTSLLTSRGCPYACSFCQVSTEWRVCRYHSAEYIVEEILDLVNNYGIHTFGVIDDLFIVNQKRIEKIVENLDKVGLLGKVHFAVNGRANLITDDLLKLLKRMGTVEIALGLESMSPRILSILKDKVTVQDNINAIDLIYKSELKIGGLFIIGTPSETIDDLDTTFNYINQNRHKFGGMQICVTTPLPNTKLWDICVEKHLIDKDISKLDWHKLNVSVANAEINVYVGDFDIDQFNSILWKFRKLWLFPFMINSTPFDESNIQYNEETLLTYDYSEISSEKHLQEGISSDFVLVEENSKKFFKLIKQGRIILVGLFNELTIVYKTNDNFEKNTEIGKIHYMNSQYPLKNTRGEIERITLSLPKGGQHRKIGVIEIELNAENIDVFINKISVDFISITNNKILPGINELPHILSGIYPVEDWPNGKIFWTNGNFIGFLKTMGNENFLVIELLTGKKQNNQELYIVSVELINESNQEVIAKKEFALPQSSWQNLTINYEPGRKAEVFQVVIKSDSFIPWDLNESIDSRDLGVAIKNILLR